MSRATVALIITAAAIVMTACQGNKPVNDVETEERQDLASGPAALFDNTHWVISQLRSVDVPTRADCGIQFDEQGQASGRSGVNNFFSQTTAGPNNALTFGVIGSTKTAGPKPDMDFEQAFFEMLQDTRRFAFLDGGQTLAFYDASGTAIARFRRQVSVAPGT